MSLARSASGPGGLSINTGVANAPSTQSTQPAPSGGLFGSTPNSTTTAPAAAAPPGGGGTMASGGGLFGGGAAQQKPGGLFGGGGAAATTNTTNTGGATGGGGLFGNTQQNTAQSGTGTTGGGLFGNAQQNQNAQQNTTTGTTGGGGLFGNAQANQGQQQTQQSTGGGLFGNANANTQQQQSQQQQSGGLFGASTANTQNNTQSSTGGGLFGQPQAKPLGGFGTSQAQNQTQNQQSTNAVPAVQINYDNLRPRTRFDDLAKPVQDEIALIDKGIARVIKMKDQIGEFMPQHERDIAQLGRDVAFVESKFRTVQVALNGDIQTVKALQDLTKKNIADAQLSFKATDNLKLPAHYHQTGLFASASTTNGTAAAAGTSAGGSAADASGTHADAQDLISYFNRICDDVEKYKKRLDEYRAEIERDMPGVENGLYEQIRTLRERHAANSNGNAEGGNGLGGGSVSDQLGQVLLVLREMGTAIVNQAGQIADTRERLSRLQAGILDSGVYAMGMAA